MTNLTHIAEGCFEQAIEHAERGDKDMAVLKAGYAFKLAVTAGVSLDHEHARALYARLTEAVDSTAGAA